MSWKSYLFASEPPSIWQTRKCEALGLRLWSARFSSRDDFDAWVRDGGSAARSREAVIRDLQATVENNGVGRYLGYCWVCDKRREFSFDFLSLNGDQINWRERLICKSCHLNTRLRLAAQIIAKLVPNGAHADVYLTEQLTPLASLVHRSCSRGVYSEFLGPGVEPGALSRAGVRHEDLTALSFADRSFDAVFSFDVLEHIPDFIGALREVRRVLRPGGVFVLTAPFVLGSSENITRARVDQCGSIEHLLPPEYHGNPVDPGGILCFYHFGWQLLANLKSVGFVDPEVRLFWSADFAYIGPEQLMIIAAA